MEAASVSDLSKFLFEEVFPEEMIIKYRENYNLDLKSEFEEYFNSRNLVPKFNLRFSKIIALDIIEAYEGFFEYAFESNISIFHLFNDSYLFKDKK